MAELLARAQNANPTHRFYVDPFTGRYMMAQASISSPNLMVTAREVILDGNGSYRIAPMTGAIPAGFSIGPNDSDGDVVMDFVDFDTQEYPPKPSDSTTPVQHPLLRRSPSIANEWFFDRKSPDDGKQYATRFVVVAPLGYRIVTNAQGELPYTLAYITDARDYLNQRAREQVIVNPEHGTFSINTFKGNNSREPVAIDILESRLLTGPSYTQAVELFQSCPIKINAKNDAGKTEEDPRKAELEHIVFSNHELADELTVLFYAFVIEQEGLDDTVYPTKRSVEAIKRKLGGKLTNTDLINKFAEDMAEQQNRVNERRAAYCKARPGLDAKTEDADTAPKCNTTRFEDSIDMRQVNSDALEQWALDNCVTLVNGNIGPDDLDKFQSKHQDYLDIKKAILARLRKEWQQRRDAAAELALATPDTQRTSSTSKDQRVIHRIRDLAYVRLPISQHLPAFNPFLDRIPVRNELEAELPNMNWITVLEVAARFPNNEADRQSWTQMAAAAAEDPVARSDLREYVAWGDFYLTKQIEENLLSVQVFSQGQSIAVDMKHMMQGVVVPDSGTTDPDAEDTCPVNKNDKVCVAKRSKQSSKAEPSVESSHKLLTDAIQAATRKLKTKPAATTTTPVSI